MLSAELVGGFLVFILAVIGCARLVAEEPAQHFMGPIIAWVEVAAAAAIIFVSAGRWSGAALGYFLVRGVYAGLLFLVFPSLNHPKSPPTTRMGAAELAIFCVLVLAAVWRFMLPKPAKMTIADRVALTIFLLSICLMFALPPALAPRAAAFGSIPLFLDWVYYFWRRSKKHRSPSKTNHSFA